MFFLKFSLVYMNLSLKSIILGCTPFSWMLLRGNKSDGTDQHSVVAKELGVTRDEAKVSQLYN
jgi:hypothetical protein